MVSHAQERFCKQISSNSSVYTHTHTHTTELSCTSSSFVYTSAAIVILFALVRLVMEVFQFCYDRKSYISDWTNFPEVLLYTLSIIFAFVFWTPCMCPHKWQWQIGVVAVLLVWIYLIRFCAKFPSTGIYIIMFGKIFITFLNVIILSLLLLTTFAITFHMTFSEEQFQVSHLQKEPTTQASFVYVFLLQHCVNINWSSIGN